MKNTKRFMALLLTLVLVFGSMSSAFAAVNEDVVDTEFEATVGKLNAIGVMEGYPDGTFRPEGEITRAEFAAIAIRALGLGDAANAAVNTIFTDVSGNHWAAGYINLAVDRGILKGYPDGTYRPEGKITNAEAITILVRLVGLGPVIDKQGTWPANYVAAANNEGVLDDVFVASTANATRGNAAKMLMNTIEGVETWIPDGYNSDGSVSYSRQADTFLLEENLGIETVEGRLMSTTTDEVEIGNDTYEYVGDDFDAEYLFLNDVDAWLMDDEVIYLVKTSDQLFDAVEFGDGELTMVEADKDYDLNLDDDDDLDIVLYVNGEEDVVAGQDPTNLDGDTYDYAKVVLNDKNDVVAVSVYNWNDFLVVDDVDEEDVIGLGTDVFVDAEDFTIVKDGKTISLDDLEDGDIFFYNDDTDVDYAEVFNRTEMGEIDRVFAASFEIDDEEYDLEVDTRFNEDFEFVAISDIADMEDAEEEVTVYLNRANELVYVVGELGDAETSSVLAYLTEDAVTDNSFGRNYVELDFVNEMSSEVTVTLRGSDLDSFDGMDYTTEFVPAFNAFTAGNVIDLTYDEDGDVTDVALLTADFTGDEELENDERYFDGKRLVSDSVVFVVDGDDVDAIEWADLDFTVDVSASYVNSDAEVLALIATDANPTDDDTVFGIVDDSRDNTDGEIVRITIVNEDGEVTYNVDKDADAVFTNDIVELVFEKDSDFVSDVKVVTGSAMTVTATSTSNRTITAGGNTYRLASGAVILDGDDDLAKLRVSDIEVGTDDIRVIFDEDSTTFVKVVIVNP